MDEKVKNIDTLLDIQSDESDVKQNPKMFVVRNHIVQQFNKMGCRMTFKTIDRINYMVARIIKDSVRRCKGNNRSTIFPRDI